MARKKSVKKTARQFIALVDEIERYYAAVLGAGLSDQHVSWATEAAVVKLSAGLEQLVLHALVGAINNNTGTLSSRSGIRFPKHLTDEVCEYIVVGTGYFDFRGRDGLIQKLKDYLPPSHYLVESISRPAYRQSIERMVALRNFAAHESSTSKLKARLTVGTNLSAAGAWLKRQNRLAGLTQPLRRLAIEIEGRAPY